MMTTPGGFSPVLAQSRPGRGSQMLLASRFRVIEFRLQLEAVVVVASLKLYQDPPCTLKSAYMVPNSRY